MNRRLALLRTVILVLLVIAAVTVYASAGQTFHGCEDGENCSDDDRVIVCIQPDSCRFGEEKEPIVQPCPPVGVPPVAPHCDPAPS